MPRLISAADYGTELSTGSARIVEQLGRPRFAAFGDINTMRRSILYNMYDFETKAFDTTNLFNVSKDTNATNFAVLAGPGGTLRGVAATTNGEGCGVLGTAVLAGNQNVGMEVRMRLSYVTNMQWEIGFTNASITDVKDPIINNLDTPTIANGSTDACFVAVNTGATLQTAALVGRTSAAGTTTKQNIGTWAPTVNQYFVVRIQLYAGTDCAAIATIWDGNGSDPLLIGQFGLAVAIAGATAIMPYINVTRVATSNINADVDYLSYWQDRV